MAVAATSRSYLKPDAVQLQGHAVQACCLAPYDSTRGAAAAVAAARSGPLVVFGGSCHSVMLTLLLIYTVPIASRVVGNA
jgi:hypothetical protein